MNQDERYKKLFIELRDSELMKRIRQEGISLDVFEMLNDAENFYVAAIDSTKEHYWQLTTPKCFGCLGERLLYQTPILDLKNKNLVLINNWNDPYIDPSEEKIKWCSTYLSEFEETLAAKGVKKIDYVTDDLK